jgi:hypothetical protein
MPCLSYITLLDGRLWETATDNVFELSDTDDDVSHN